jgi:hypothetical protein
MLVFNYIALFIILITLVFLYNRFLSHQKSYWGTDEYEGLREILLNKNNIKDDHRPILWIYVPYQYNSRHWESFGSRSSHDLNQPYLYMTVKSIINHCDRSFNICIIDDDSFGKLIPT